jgi:hypothetical protein
MSSYCRAKRTVSVRLSSEWHIPPLFVGDSDDTNDCACGPAVLLTDGCPSQTPQDGDSTAERISTVLETGTLIPDDLPDSEQAMSGA